MDINNSIELPNLEEIQNNEIISNISDSPMLNGIQNPEAPVKQKRKRRNYQPEEKIDFSVGLQEENTK